jgi:hypothetical protein
LGIKDGLLLPRHQLADAVGGMVLDGFQHPCKPSLWVYALELACLDQSIGDGNWVMVMPALANGMGKSCKFGIPFPAVYRRYAQPS